jgi:hypothetical protein
MARSIVGPFETREPDIDYQCMIGDIASTAGLTVHEPDDGPAHFARWRPSIRMAFPALRSRRHRATTIGR